MASIGDIYVARFDGNSWGELLGKLQLNESGSIFTVNASLQATHTVSGSDTTKSFSLTPTWNTSGAPTAFFVNVANTTSHADAVLADIQIDSVSKLKIPKLGNLILSRVYTTALPTIGDGSGGLGFSGGSTFFASSSISNAAIYYLGIQVSSTLGIGFAAGAADSGGLETAWFRVSNGVIAQRGGATAQTYQVYGAYTDSSNYVRASLSSSTTAVTLAAETAGTGDDNINLILNSAGTGKVGVNTASPKSTFDINGGIGADIVTKTTDYTATDSNFTILCDATSNNITITLPTAASSTKRIYNIKKIDSSGNTVTIDADSSEQVDGALTQVITTQYSSLTIQCNGTAWWII